MVTIKKYSLLSLTVLIGLTVVLIAVLSAKYNSVDLHLSMDEAVGLETPWRYQQDGKETEILLPVQLSGIEGEEWEIYNQLPAQLPDNQYLCLRASNQSLKVFVDEELIYRRLTDEQAYIGKVIWGNWNLIPLKQEHAGKEIRIAFSTPYQEYVGFINKITYGSENENLYSIIRANGSNFITSLIMLLVGAVLLLLGIFIRVRKVPDRSMVYLALFTILFAIWMLGESRMLQFIVGNPILATTMNFWGFLLFPIPLLLFMGESYETHHPRIIPILFIGFMANFIINVILQLLRIYDFLSTIWSTHILCVITIFLILGDCLIEVRKYKNKGAARILGALCLFFTLALIQIACFYLEDIVTLSVTRYMGIGYLAFILYISIDILLRIQKMSEAKKEREYFERLAYTDLLTVSENRSAYIRDMDNFFAAGQTEKLGLVLFDINNLKMINDNYGHLMGDDAIKQASACIKKTFGKLGGCYRIGGDEFASIIFHADEQLFKHLEGEFYKEVEATEKTVKYPFHMAVGYDVYDSKNDNNGYETFYARVDRLMYDNKNKYKKAMEE